VGWMESGCPVTDARAWGDNAMPCSRSRAAIFIQGLRTSTEPDPMTLHLAQGPVCVSWGESRTPWPLHFNTIRHISLKHDIKGMITKRHFVFPLP